MGQSPSKQSSEHAAIITGIGHATAAWSALEGGLSNCFSLLAFREFGNPTAGVIFYSPNNFESRMRLVSDLVAFLLKADSDLTSRWSTIKGRIQRKQSVRNAIAHGSIIFTSKPGTTETIVRLTPALGDWLRWTNDPTKTGMKGGDIKGFADAVWHLSAIMGAYNRALGKFLGAPDFHQPIQDQTYDQLVRELDSQIQARNTQSPTELETGSPA